ncbi:DUF3365 domain-containing protein [Algoriphagus aestuarii]|nr:DUF3365 domain-containing protein [Algoriphagus aestuarii]
MKNYLALVIYSILFYSCGPRERVSKEVFDEVNKTMEVKRVTDAEITQEAMIWGDSITAQAQKNLISNLQKAIEEGGLVHAIGFCSENATELTNALDPSEGVIIRRVSIKNRNPMNSPDENEALILDAYVYNSEQGLESEANIQKIENGEVLLYTKAIIFPSGICQNCHGNPESEVPSEVVEAIQGLYPEDKALGFKAGDLRGMWSVKIPKKSIVNRL